jgi:hypothetical protein
MYTVDDPKKRAVGFKLSEGMEVPEELASRFKFASQKSKLGGTLRGSYFAFMNEHSISGWRIEQAGDQSVTARLVTWPEFARKPLEMEKLDEQGGEPEGGGVTMDPTFTTARASGRSTSTNKRKARS